MSEELQTYALLQDACRRLDDASDHSIAAYVGLAMALMEEKYGIASSESAADGVEMQDALGHMPPPKRHITDGGAHA